MLDVEHMREETAGWSEHLFPWVEANEISLFSLKHDTKWVKSSMGRYMKGVYYSIYDEPMLVFAAKSYVKKGLNTLIWASTKKHEFIFRGKRDRTEVFIDREAVGHITHNGLLYGGSRNRLLGRRNDYSDEYYSIVIWDKEVAHLAKPNKISRLNTRAVEVLEDMSTKEELLLIALGFLTIVHDTYGRDGTSK
jgi:hypothetical protein